MRAGREEDFRATSGQVLGVLGVVASLLVPALVLLDPGLAVPAWGWPAALLAAVLLWSAMLRPRVWVAGGALVLRTMFETVHVPLAAVEDVTVRQVLVVRAGGRRYTCAALGRSRRRLVGRSSGYASRFTALLEPGDVGGSGSTAGGARGVVDYADFVEARLVELTTRARQQARVRRGSREQRALADGVRRYLAWPEVLAGAIGLLATVLLAALA